MRVLGLDYGEKTVGVAISDPDRKVSVPLETIKREDPAALKQTIQRIRSIVTANGVDLIVLGLPRNMDGTEGERAEKTRAFKKRLERDVYRVTVELWDERLTTVAAERPLKELHKNRFERKEVVDSMAAALILQGYLDSLQRKEEIVMEQEERQIILYEPEEQLKSTMNVFASLTLENTQYFLAAVAYEEDDLDEEDDFDEEDGVFIFRICSAEEAEFMVLKEDGITDYYVTTELGDRMQEVIEAFQDMDDDFDLITDED